LSFSFFGHIAMWTQVFIPIMRVGQISFLVIAFSLPEPRGQFVLSYGPVYWDGIIATKRGEVKQRRQFGDHRTHPTPGIGRICPGTPSAVIAFGAVWPTMGQYAGIPLL